MSQCELLLQLQCVCVRMCVCVENRRVVLWGFGTKRKTTRRVCLFFWSHCFCPCHVFVLVLFDAPLKTRHFVPQTNMSAHESQNNARTNKFYICKCVFQRGVSQGFQRYFHHRGQRIQRSSRKTVREFTAGRLSVLWWFTVGRERKGINLWTKKKKLGQRSHTLKHKIFSLGMAQHVLLVVY